jgi:Rps23 Pro-64 3,4-dihydroxylase Tpa1-like proline 4-hydroxylase
VDGSWGATADLSSAWLQLARELQESSYRDALALATGVDLSAARLGAAFWRYPRAGFLGPHVDEPYKLVSHVIYFSDDWSPSWGGELRILDDAGALHSFVTPSLGNSVVVVRSQNSWHEVAPVSSDSASVRKSLQVVFHVSDFRGR